MWLRGESKLGFILVVPAFFFFFYPKIPIVNFVLLRFVSLTIPLYGNSLSKY